MEEEPKGKATASSFSSRNCFNISAKDISVENQQSSQQWRNLEVQPESAATLGLSDFEVALLQ